VRTKEIVPIQKDALHSAGIYLSPHTLYRWRSAGKYPRLFTKIGGRVFIVLSEWNRLVERNKGKRVRRRKKGERKNG